MGRRGTSRSCPSATARRGAGRHKDVQAALAEIYIAETATTLSRPRSRLRIVEAASGAPVASFRAQRGGGLLQLADGQEFSWARSGRWGSGGTFTQPAGPPLLHLRWKPGPLKAGARVEILPQATSLVTDDLLFLIVVAWYLMRLKADDDAIAAAAAAIAATSG